MHDNLPNRDIVLLGVGHTNAHVLLKWRMNPIADTRLTCVSDHPFAVYSGMLPGLLAGQYQPDECRIDLVRLCAAAGARLILDDAVGLDTEARRLRFRGRPPIRYDALSVGVGSRPTVPPGVGDRDVAIKPMQTFLERLDDALASVNEARVAQPIRVVIVGGGPAGAELGLSLPRYLRQHHPDVAAEFTLVDANIEPLATRPPRTRRLFERAAEACGLRLMNGARVREAGDEGLLLSDGAVVPRDVAVWATSASAPPVIDRLGLRTDESGRIQTRSTLQSVDDDRVFAVGDSGVIRGQERPGAGVFAVRQGPYLWSNLQRLLSGEKLRAYRPQKSTLTLINTADDRAILSWRSISLVGRPCWSLKDKLDTRFVRKHQDYQQAAMPSKPLERAPVMWCGGCGSKVAGDLLASVLADLDNPVGDGVTLGLDAGEDVALLKPDPGAEIALTTDFFTAFVDDPHLLGRVAALNAMSDLFAKNATPLGALAMVAVPHGPIGQQRQELLHTLAGSLEELRPLGVPLLGGHTVEAASPMIGFTMIGRASPAAPRKGGLRAGDQLVLTKPIGVGALLAAHMRAACRHDWWTSLMASMLTSNAPASQIARRHEIVAMTDVTGFGLAGHLLEMLRASHVSADVALDQIPCLRGATEAIAGGFASTLAPGNRRSALEVQLEDSVGDDPRSDLLFDPQTSGGLLMGAPSHVVDRLLGDLGPSAAVIGRVQEPADGRTVLSVRPTTRH